jgi:hypothetical protein
LARTTDIKRNPKFEGWFQAHVGRQVKAVTKAVARDAIVECPIDSGDLVSSIRTRFPGLLKGQVVVGGTSRRHMAHDVNYWAAVEYGSRPHTIRSHGRWSLRSDDGEYFGRVVHHPGTKAQPFMRTALYRRRKMTRLDRL